MSDEEWGLDDYLRSSEDLRDQESAHVFLYGPEDTGKTSTATTVTKKQRSKPVKGKKVYDDIVHIGFDRGALLPLLEQGIEVPRYLDIPWLMSEPKKGEKRPWIQDWDEVMPLVKDVVAEQVSKYGLVGAIFDTVTSFGILVEKAADIKADNHEFDSNRGSFDKWAQGRWIQRQYRELHNLGMALDCIAVWCGHSKAKSEPDDPIKAAAKKKKVKAREGPGDWSYQIDLPGAWEETRNMYTANNSIVFSTSATGTDPANLTYKIHPGGGNGFMGKNKWRKLLKPDEEPNLRAIFDRIKKGG